MLIVCPDAPGIVWAVSQFIKEHGGNILHFDQHVDTQTNTFFMRAEWELGTKASSQTAVQSAFHAVAEQFSMTWQLHHSEIPRRMAIFVTKQSHCLYDLLSRVASKEWQVEVPVIIGNHRHLESVAEQFGIPFAHFEITRENKLAQEQRQIALLDQYKVDFVVLARYMQIVSPSFLEVFANRVINIHHSFLPAFPGAKPYHSAFARGVKIIGATSHYVTSELDAGPIIEQDVVRISHKHSVSDMIRMGRDLEKIVLSRAVRKHLTHKILVYNNKTVVF